MLARDLVLDGLVEALEAVLLGDGARGLLVGLELLHEVLVARLLRRARLLVVLLGINLALLLALVEAVVVGDLEQLGRRARGRGSLGLLAVLLLEVTEALHDVVVRLVDVLLDELDRLLEGRELLVDHLLEVLRGLLVHIEHALAEGLHERHGVTVVHEVQRQAAKARLVAHGLQREGRALRREDLGQLVGVQALVARAVRRRLDGLLLVATILGLGLLRGRLGGRLGGREGRGRDGLEAHALAHLLGRRRLAHDLSRHLGRLGRLEGSEDLSAQVQVSLTH